jgi:antitoxin MazE
MWMTRMDVIVRIPYGDGHGCCDHCPECFLSGLSFSLAAFSRWIYIPDMTTTLQAWGNSQGVRLPKALLAALNLEAGADVEIGLSPKKDAIIVKPVKAPSRVRGRHRIEGLVATMPKGYKSVEFAWGTSGREVW